MSQERVVDDAAIVAAIKELTADRGYAPTVRELGKRVGMTSPGSVHRRLLELRDLGLVAFEEQSPRTLRVIEQEEGACGT